MVIYGIPKRAIEETEKRLAAGLSITQTTIPEHGIFAAANESVLTDVQQFNNSATIIKPSLTLTEKQTAYKILRDEGQPVKDAAKALGYTKGHAYDLERKFRKYAITGNEKLLRQASKSLNHLVKGEAFGDLKDVKCSTVMAAINQVYDRYEPIVKQTFNVNAELSIAPVDLSIYRTDIASKDMGNNGGDSNEGEDSIESTPSTTTARGEGG